MNIAIKNQKESLPGIMNVLDSYDAIVDNVETLIEGSGCNIKLVAQRLNMAESTFHAKKKERRFYPSEIRRIIELLGTEDDESAENEYLLKIAEERKNDERISFDELLSTLS